MSKLIMINDRYELEALPIARGGMGEVWGGRDIVLDREIAVKLIRFPDGVPDQDYIRRFERESRITARLNHPGVPTVYDVGTYEGRPFLVMQRVRGINLADLIAEHGPLPIGWAAGIAAQVCAVLVAAHHASLVHRDLKPSNVMMEPDGGIKVLDFGLAAAPTLADFSKITHSGQPIGTPAYMAPEQILAAISGPQTDLYALGCTLHEMLAGAPLFTGTTSYALMSQQVSEPPRSLRTIRPEVPAELAALVLALLEKKPENRPASAEVVYHQLLPFADRLEPLPGALDPPSTLSPVRMYARVLGTVFTGTRTDTATRATAGAAASGPAAPVEPLVLTRDRLDQIRAQAASLALKARYRQAAELLASTVEPASRALGPTDSDVLNLRLELADVLFEGGDYRAAAPEYQRLGADLVTLSGSDSEQALHCRQRLATCHAFLGDTGRALQQLIALLADESRIFAPDDPRTLELRRQIALLQLGTGDRDAAYATLTRLLSDLTRLRGDEHTATVEVRDLLTKIKPNANTGAPPAASSPTAASSSAAASRRPADSSPATDSAPATSSNPATSTAPTADRTARGGWRMN